ncbi:DUF4349 domain-containing protein [Leptobacterium flavescens]|uniref:DUF4349 domain-containing protein n=1 Tax=Leptobacterium flavescens TaxID=472055 RepID=A0A6P0UP61_9FLAO|nr:DUF4349 domain-containing protein [Leptobacterium flavescens]NER14230.1 DUF4349 domain-containing protein [Leptobacterium flavescens]
MKTFSWFLLSLILACSGNSGTELSYSELDEAEELVVEDLAISSPSPRFEVQQKREQKIIKESYLRFETKDLEKTYQDIIRFTNENGGYIQSDESGKGYREHNRTMVIRIPTSNFQKTIDAISADVAYFDTKRITSKDVTEEFIDLEARLKAKKTLENRYLELLDKAKTVKEILEIEKELSSIREEIEAREGRLKYLQDRVSYSSLTISFYKRSSESGITVSYGSKMLNALKSGFNGLSYFFLGLLNIWPFILILIFGVYVIRRKYFKKSKK